MVDFANEVWFGDEDAWRMEDGEGRCEAAGRLVLGGAGAG